MKRFFLSAFFLFSAMTFFAIDYEGEKDKISDNIDILTESEKHIQKAPEENADLTKKTGSESEFTLSLGVIGLLLANPETKTGETHFSAPSGVLPFALADFTASYNTKLFFDSVFPLLSANFTSYISLVGAKGSASISFPFIFFPLINFSFVGEVSTGFFSNSGVYDIEKREYNEEKGFSNFQYNLNGKAGLMLPLSKHLLTFAGYGISYQGLSSASKNDLWTGGNFNGFVWNASLAALYLIPSKLNCIGVLAGVSRHFSDDDLDERYKGFDGRFTSYGIYLLATYKFTEKDSLFVLSPFANRRSFSVFHEESNEEPLLETTGSEWYWGGIIIKYTHFFKK